MILPCEMLQLDIPNMWAEIIFYNFFLGKVRKTISVQEIYSDSFLVHCLNKPNKNNMYFSTALTLRGMDKR